MSYYCTLNSQKSEEQINKELDKATSIADGQYANNQLIVKLIAVHAITIGERAFENCSNLNDVFLGPEIIKIGSGAFANCPMLKDVWFPMLDRNAKVEIAEDAFKGSGKICFHVFGLGHPTCGNTAIEEYAKAHHFGLESMI